MSRRRRRRNPSRKKKDNTLLIFGVAAIAGYLWYTNSASAGTVAPNTSANQDSGGVDFGVSGSW